MNKIYTVNPLYTGIRYNDKTRYNDNLNGKKSLPQGEMDYLRNLTMLYLIFQETHVVDNFIIKCFIDTFLE